MPRKIFCDRDHSFDTNCLSYSKFDLLKENPRFPGKGGAGFTYYGLTMRSLIDEGQEVIVA